MKTAPKQLKRATLYHQQLACVSRRISGCRFSPPKIEETRAAKTGCSRRLTDSLQAYIRDGLLSEGFLRLRFGGLIFLRAYFRALIIVILRYNGHTQNKTFLPPALQMCSSRKYPYSLHRRLNLPSPRKFQFIFIHCF